MGTPHELGQSFLVPQDVPLSMGSQRGEPEETGRRKLSSCRRSGASSNYGHAWNPYVAEVFLELRVSGKRGGLRSWVLTFGDQMVQMAKGLTRGVVARQGPVPPAMESMS